MKIAIFASGNGSNFQAIAQACQKGTITGQIALLICDKKNAYVIQRAKQLDIPFQIISYHDFDSKEKYEQVILKKLQQAKVEFVVLAGYMRVIGPTLLQAFPKKIINIHPSLLPDFPGLHGIKDAFEKKVTKTGVTIHYIDEGVDTGPIIAQESLSILSEDTLTTLEMKIHHLEHRLYPKIIQKMIEK